MKLKGEKQIVIETKRRGHPPVRISAVETTARLFLDYLHNKLLEAKKEGKGLEVKTT